MRKTKQTSLHLERLGPFFVGKAIWQNEGRYRMKTAVLLLAYGGPDSLADIPAYLLDIRGGRETPQALVDEITHRYAAIGGFSPLLRITQRRRRSLQERTGLPVYVGMRHWTPWIKDTVAQMAADGVERAA
jgi:ferrochelatase